MTLPGERVSATLRPVRRALFATMVSGLFASGCWVSVSAFDAGQGGGGGPAGGGAQAMGGGSTAGGGGGGTTGGGSATPPDWHQVDVSAVGGSVCAVVTDGTQVLAVTSGGSVLDVTTDSAAVLQTQLWSGDETICGMVVTDGGTFVLTAPEQIFECAFPCDGGFTAVATLDAGGVAPKVHGLCTGYGTTYAISNYGFGLRRGRDGGWARTIQNLDGQAMGCEIDATGALFVTNDHAIAKILPGDNAPTIFEELYPASNTWGAVLCVPAGRPLAGGLYEVSDAGSGTEQAAIFGRMSDAGWVSILAHGMPSPSSDRAWFTACAVSGPIAVLGGAPPPDKGPLIVFDGGFLAEPDPPLPVHMTVRGLAFGPRAQLWVTGETTGGPAVWRFGP